MRTFSYPTFATLDPRIGMLSSGKFYCFPGGNGKHEFVGSLEEVEEKLGLRARARMSAEKPTRDYVVTASLRRTEHGWPEPQAGRTSYANAYESLGALAGDREDDGAAAGDDC